MLGRTLRSLQGTSRLLTRLAGPAAELGAQGGGLPQALRALPAALTGSSLAGATRPPVWVSMHSLASGCNPTCNSVLLRELHSTVQAPSSKELTKERLSQVHGFASYSFSKHTNTQDVDFVKETRLAVGTDGDLLEQQQVGPGSEDEVGVSASERIHNTMGHKQGDVEGASTVWERKRLSGINFLEELWWLLCEVVAYKARLLKW